MHLAQAPHQSDRVGIRWTRAPARADPRRVGCGRDSREGGAALAVERVHDRHLRIRRRSRERARRHARARDRRRDHRRDSRYRRRACTSPSTASRDSGDDTARRCRRCSSGVPSIVLGYVGYVTSGRSLPLGLLTCGAALIVLSVLVVPYITKIHRGRHQKRADQLSGGGRGSRASRAHTCSARPFFVRRCRGSRPASSSPMAIAMGETAPLIYTAGFNDGLPGAPWHLDSQPGRVPHLHRLHRLRRALQLGATQLANEAALVLVALVIVLILVLGSWSAVTQRHCAGPPERPPMTDGRFRSVVRRNGQGGQGSSRRRRGVLP